jgi:D-alanine-D-alanine ligase-like ATP-grasp enzyme
MVLASREREVPIVRAPLYTLYVKKADEYRVHVVRDKMIDYAQKKKRRTTPNEKVDYQIRNYANGWVFCRDGVAIPDCVRYAAISSVSALGLDFGGVDIGYNAHEGTACVYEVNTAPGIEGTTLVRYREALTELIPELRGRAYARRRGEG